MKLDLPDGSLGGTYVHPQGRREAGTVSGRVGTSGSGPARRGSIEEERIAGFVIYRMHNGVVEYLLLKKVLQNDWSPPKGHVENGEDCFDGAEREVLEETSFIFSDYETLDKYPICFEYKTRQQILKKVHLWAAKYLNLEKSVRLSPEHDEFQWLDYEAAMAVVKRQYKEALMAADLVIRTYESL